MSRVSRSLMQHAVAACVVVTLTFPAVGSAQALSPAPETAPAGITTFEPAAPLFGPEIRDPQSSARSRRSGGFWEPFKEIPGDFVRFASPGSLKILAIGGAGALAAHQWDGKGIEEAQEHLRPGAFKAGNVGGGVFVQAGAAFGLYSVAKLAGSNEFAVLGADLVRSQVLSQAIVQAGKFTMRRPRPDGSNTQSLPSGHTASAFATATVLQQHYGWKVGVPAYGFGVYVAASRMSANKHHLSDVLLGAAIGVAAGRTVTVGSGRARFDLGVAPTAGGAAITFTKR